MGELSGRIEELTRTLGGTANAVMRNRIQQQIDEQQVHNHDYTPRAICACAIPPGLHQDVWRSRC